MSTSMTVPSTVTADSGVLRYPGLERRSELLQRRPRALRRHTTRVATRFAVLLTGDILAILIAQAIAHWLSAETARGNEAFAGSPLVMDGRRMLFLAIATLVAIFAAGGHSRHRALNQPIRLFGAAAGACLINWAPAIAKGYGASITLTFVATTATLWLSVLVIRELSEWFLHHVWPRQRGAAAAILVGDPDKARSFERAIGAAGGDYRVVGYLATSDSSNGNYIGTVTDLS